MPATQIEIEALAGRIQRAYLLRHPHFHAGCSAPRIWATAAAFLAQAHEDDPSLPLDPELYVAAQPVQQTIDDPWSELAQPASARRYRSRIRQIVLRLRTELGGELRLAERRLHRGELLESILHTRSRLLSPLGRYLIALRAGRDDLKERWRSQAIEQDRSCPLYRQASRTFIPAEDYPAPPPTTVRNGTPRRSRPQASLN